MKRVFSLFALFMAVVTFFSCNKETDPTDEVKNDTKELIVTAEASDIDYTSVTLYGYANLTEGMTGVTFGIIVSEDDDPDIKNGRCVPSKMLDSNNKFYVQFSALKIGKKYYYRAYLKEGDYYRMGSKVMSFTTKDFTDKSIVTGEASYINDTYVTLNGTTDLPSNVKAELFGIILSNEENPTVENGQLIVAEKWDDDHSSFSCLVTDLSRETKYYYKAYFHDLDRDEYYRTGETRSFTTKAFEFAAVDLGLSVKWANANLGASLPEEYGDYYAWGEIEVKDKYDWPTYKWGSNLTKYNSTDKKTILDPEDDAAHVKLGGTWRMPTYVEFKELMRDCRWFWTSLNGVRGYLIESEKNGNCIFLPAAGFRDGTSLRYAGSQGRYWSSSRDKDYKDSAASQGFDSEGLFLYVSSIYSRRYYGFSVRPVSE